MQLQGVFPAVVTPFTPDGSEVDYISYESLLKFLGSAGVAGLVVGGSTGESPTLSEAELLALVGFTVARGGFTKIIAGVNNSSTKSAVELAAKLRGAGADTLLVTSPPYNKPTQEGLFQHFTAVAESFDGPVIAYNIPGRTGVRIESITIAKLVSSGSVFAVKDSTGQIQEPLALSALLWDGVSILSGEDALTLAILSSGGSGVISASANLIPKTMKGIISSWESGDRKAALTFQLQALPVISALFTESNPIPVKYALARRGIIESAAVRLPLTEPSESCRRLLDALELPEIDR